MIRKIVKYISVVLLAVIIFSIVAVVTPRIWSALNPEKPPVGYHFMALAYVALWIGLEKIVTALIDKTYEDSPGLYLEASPVNYLDKSDPPTLILHGTSDRLVPVSQSDNLKSALDSLGVPCVYYRIPLWPHTMDIVKRVNDFCQEKMTEFFSIYLN